MNKLFIMCVTMLLASSQLMANDKITLKDVTGQTFTAQSVTKIEPVNGTDLYVGMSDDGKQIIEYSFKTSKQTRTLFDVSHTQGEQIKQLEGFVLSPDGRKLLIQTNTKKIYRRSFTADYYIYTLQSRKLERLSAGGPQQVPTWSPDGNQIAFVRDNNIFLVKLLYDNAESQVTKDGKQREIINAERHDVITANRDLAPEIHAMIKRTIDRFVDGNSRAPQEEKLDSILYFAKYNLVPEESISLSDLQGLSDEEIKANLYERALEVYNSQIAKLRDEEAVREFQKVLILRVVDNKWTDHIDALDQLRNAVGLRGYAQNNPVVEYQSESFRMFNDMIGSIEFDVTRLMMKAQIHEQERPRTEHNIVTTATRNISAQESDLPADVDLAKVGRNELCPCGSGKKFKNCHGRR